MADGLPRSRRDLRDWCLRKLGAPVLQINMDEDQIEDRLSEGLSYFRDYHFDGIEKVFFKHKVTSSRLNIVGSPIGTFLPGEVIKGVTSNACVVFVSITDGQFRIKAPTGTFIGSETIQGQDSGATATLTLTNFIVLGDIDNGYIPVGDTIIGVTDILPLGSGLPTSGSIFDINYQFALNSMHSLISTDLVSYYMFKSHVELMRMLFQGKKGLRFNRVTDRVYIDIDWLHNTVKPDEYVILVAYQEVDPLTFGEVYSNYFVREFCFAILKQQWGENLKKYNGIALPGNVTLNGQAIYDEAVKYREELELRIKKEWQEPVDFLVG